jgi:hypothetical protein
MQQMDADGRKPGTCISSILVRKRIPRPGLPGLGMTMRGSSAIYSNLLGRAPMHAGLL